MYFLRLCSFEMTLGLSLILAFIETARVNMVGNHKKYQ